MEHMFYEKEEEVVVNIIEAPMKVMIMMIRTMRLLLLQRQQRSFSMIWNVFMTSTMMIMTMIEI
eukprot:4940055-Ditylum_brightwellii.AAC.1